MRNTFNDQLITLRSRIQVEETYKLTTDMMQITELKLKAHIDLDRGLLYGYIEDLTTGKPYIFDSSQELFECVRRAVGLRGTSIHHCDKQNELPGLIEKITAREQAEEALHNIQERMAAIIGSAMDAIITIGADQHILGFNSAAEKVFCCTAAEAIGHSLDRFIPVVFREAHRRQVEAFATSGATSRSMHSPSILSGLRANGEEFPLEATISRATVGGEMLCTVILRDLTQRIQTEQALIRSEKLASVGRMAASIAHEINNPLQAVANLLFLVRRIDGLPETARLFLERADSELNRIAHIMRQSLWFYREFSAPAATSVNGLLDSAVDLLKGKIEAKHATIERQWASDTEIKAIAGELRQVFANLLANSLDAIDKNGVVTLRVSSQVASDNGQSRIRVTVADNGIGIGRAAQKQIFEPFFTTKGTVGTGLGLWVSKQIVDKHGGTIQVRSSTDRKHRGTVLSVILPVELAEKPSGAAQAA